MFGLINLSEYSHRIEILATHKDNGNSKSITIINRGNRMYERFFYIMEGTAYFKLSDKSVVSAPKNSIVYLPYDIPYRCTWDMTDGCRYLCINFIIFNKNNEIINLSDNICIAYFDKEKRLLKMFEQLNEQWLSSIHPKLEYLHIFYGILSAMQSNTELSQKGKSIQEMIAFLECNYIENIPVSRLAAMCNMSLTAFRKSFKEHAGTSPVKFRNDLKLKKAKEMLETTEYNISEISDILGFTDIYYFSKLFKNRYGCTPSAYKKNCFVRF